MEVTLGDIIKNKRKELNLTQEEFAQKLYLTQGEVSKIEKNSRNLNCETLLQIEQVLNINLETLLKENKFNEIDENLIHLTLAYKKMKKHNRKKNKRKNLIIVVLSIISIFLITLLFTLNNYSNCELYEITSADEKNHVSGEIIITNEQEIMNINEVIITDISLKSKLAYGLDYRLYANGKLVLGSGDISSMIIFDTDIPIELDELVYQEIRIHINESSNYDEVIKNEFNNMKLVINFMNENKEIEQIIIPLNVEEVFSNDQIFYDGGNHI